MTERQQTAAAKAFARRWAGHGYEKGETQPFWSDLLRTVFDSESVGMEVEYEKTVKCGKDETQYIDAYIATSRVLIGKAHLDNDQAVMQAYGFDPKSVTETECVAALFNMYTQLTTAI